MQKTVVELIDAAVTFKDKLVITLVIIKKEMRRRGISVMLNKLVEQPILNSYANSIPIDSPQNLVSDNIFG